MTININLDEIEATAKSASEGLWEVDYNTPFSLDMVGIFHPEHSRYIVKFDSDYDGTVEVSVGDAAHIAAARPEVVLALIERVRAAEAALSTPPADDVREAMLDAVSDVLADAFSDAVTERIAADVLTRLSVTHEVRPQGPVTDAEVDAAARSLAGLSEELWASEKVGGDPASVAYYVNQARAALQAARKAGS